jgi:L-asparaginase
MPAALLILLATLLSPLPDAPDLPRVHVVATGGTIASTPGGMLTGEALVGALPGLERVARVSVEQFMDVGSSQITPADWLRLSLRVNELLRTRPDLAGIVVTHGTDTLEETAFFLHLTVADPRPVVLTGAMRPALAPGADGPANLLNAIRVAADPAARGRPVLVLMNDEVHGAPAAGKVHTTSVDAFVSTWGGHLAATDPAGVAWHAPPWTSPLRGEFTPSPQLALPRVDIAYTFAGADGAAVRAAAGAGAAGLVVATVGRGNMPAAQRDAVRQFAAESGPVVLSSRTQAGRVPGGADGRIMGAGELNPQKARVLLMLCLATGLDTGRIAELFGAF